MKKPVNINPIIDQLQMLYPESHCALIHNNAYELLVATMLSAQCTDKRVNMVTPSLFKAFPKPASLAQAEVSEVEELIKTTGFFRNKAKNLVGMGRLVTEKHNGTIPDTIDDLIALPGVGRKTANVVLGNIFNVPGMVVDTHVKRLATRFGWTKNQTPVKIEQDLCTIVKPELWTQLGHMMIDHGRAICKAPTPTCSQCPLIPHCPQTGVTKAK